MQEVLCKTQIYHPLRKRFSFLGGEVKPFMKYKMHNYSKCILPHAYLEITNAAMALGSLHF